MQLLLTSVTAAAVCTWADLDSLGRANSTSWH